MDKYFVINDDVECRAVVRTYKTGQKVEITIFTKMMDFRAEVIDNDLYAAFDLAIDKLEGQMRKLKTRLDRRNKDGLGKSIAKLLSDKNNIITISKTEENAMRISKEIPSAECYACDITKPNEVDKTIKTIIENQGDIDILINRNINN